MELNRLLPLSEISLGDYLLVSESGSGRAQFQSQRKAVK